MTEKEAKGTAGQRASGLVAALIVGAVLLFSALTKIVSASAFVATVTDYGILPAPFVLPAAAAVVGLEVALGLMLVLGPGRRTAAWISVPLVVFFAGMVIRAMQLGLSDCGCFGEVVEIPPPVELGIDVLLLGLLVHALRFAGEIRLGAPLVGATLGWGGLVAGMLAFLWGGPVVSSEQALEVARVDLDVLARADPPVELGEDAFLFFFSADCDHCWAFAGTLELMHRRVEGLPVHAITFSDRAAIEQFEEAFAPSYPIHVVDEPTFDALVSTYPSAVWLQAGGVAGAWAGFVPSHRQIVESGGYWYRSEPEPTEVEAPALEPAPLDSLPEARPDSLPERPAQSLFGGTVRGR